MNELLLLVSNLLLGILDIIVIVYCIYYFMMKQERNIYRKKWCYVLGAVLIFLWIIGLTIFGSDLISSVGFLTMIVAAGFVLFNNSRLHVFYHLVFGVLFLAVQVLAISLVNMGFVQMKFPMKEYGIFYSDVILLVKQMFELMLTKMAVEFVKRRQLRDFPIKRMLSYLVLPCLSICFLLSLVSFGYFFPVTSTFLVIAFNMLLLVGMNLYVTYLFEKMEKNKELEQALSLHEQQAEIQLRYYKGLEEKYQGSRKLIHDMRNHLVTLETLYNQEQAVAEPGRPVCGGFARHAE